MSDKNKKTNVLYVLDTLKQRAGVTSVAMNYFENIDRSRIHIDFLVLSDSEEAIIDNIKSSGSTVFFMPSLRVGNIIKTIKFYNDFFREHNNYKIVHSHFNQLDFLIFPIAKKHGVKHCISHSHNTKYSDYKIRAIRNWFMCLPIRVIADTWAACGIKAGEFLYGSNFLDSPKHLIINNAIDIENFKFDQTKRDNKRKELGLNNKIILGNVGRLNIQKNHIFLLNMFAELLKKEQLYDDYHLLIVGDGELKNELIKLSEDLGLVNRVTFLGSRNDVNELLQAMDVFLLPSLYEGLPVIGIEAQASGIKCIFSDRITREVDIYNVEFIPIDETEIWVDEILKIKNYNRTSSENTIRNSGFSIKDEGKKLSDFYESV